METVRKLSFLLLLSCTSQLVYSAQDETDQKVEINSLKTSAIDEQVRALQTVIVNNLVVQGNSTFSGRGNFLSGANLTGNSNIGGGDVLIGTATSDNISLGFLGAPAIKFYGNGMDFSGVTLSAGSGTTYLGLDDQGLLVTLTGGGGGSCSCTDLVGTATLTVGVSPDPILVVAVTPSGSNANVEIDGTVNMTGNVSMTGTVHINGPSVIGGGTVQLASNTDDTIIVGVNGMATDINIKTGSSNDIVFTGANFDLSGLEVCAGTITDQYLGVDETSKKLVLLPGGGSSACPVNCPSVTATTELIVQSTSQDSVAILDVKTNPFGQDSNVTVNGSFTITGNGAILGNTDIEGNFEVNQTGTGNTNIGGGNIALSPSVGNISLTVVDPYFINLNSSGAGTISINAGTNDIVLGGANLDLSELAVCSGTITNNYLGIDPTTKKLELLAGGGGGGCVCTDLLGTSSLTVAANAQPPVFLVQVTPTGSNSNVNVTGSFAANGTTIINGGSSTNATTIGNAAAGAITIDSGSTVGITSVTELDLNAATINAIGLLNINANQNFNTNICTGTSTGATAIGNSTNGGAMTFGSASTVTITGTTGIGLTGPTTITGGAIQVGNGPGDTVTVGNSSGVHDLTLQTGSSNLINLSGKNLNFANIADLSTVTSGSNYLGIDPTSKDLIFLSGSGGTTCPVNCASVSASETLQAVGTGVGAVPVFLAEVTPSESDPNIAIEGSLVVNGTTIINGGSSTNATTIGNAAAGAITIDSGSTVGITSVTELDLNAATINAIGLVNINASQNFNTNICTGTSTGVTTIGSLGSGTGVNLYTKTGDIQIKTAGTGDIQLEATSSGDINLVGNTNIGGGAIAIGTDATDAITIGTSTQTTDIDIKTGSSNLINLTGKNLNFANIADLSTVTSGSNYLGIDPTSKDLIFLSGGGSGCSCTTFSATDSLTVGTSPQTIFVADATVSSGPGIIMRGTEIVLGQNGGDTVTIGYENNAGPTVSDVIIQGAITIGNDSDNLSTVTIGNTGQAPKLYGLNITTPSASAINAIGINSSNQIVSVPSLALPQSIEGNVVITAQGEGTITITAASTLVEGGIVINDGGLQVTAGGILATGATSINTTSTFGTEIGNTTGELALTGSDVSIQGTAYINADTNANVGICTGTSAGVTTIGNATSGGGCVVTSNNNDILLNAKGTGLLSLWALDTGAIHCVGDVNINTSQNYNVNICDGTSTGIVTIGNVTNGEGIVLNSYNNDIVMNVAGAGAVLLRALDSTGQVLLFGDTLVNENQNNNVGICSGTSSGVITLGNTVNGGGLEMYSKNNDIALSARGTGVLHLWSLDTGFVDCVGTTKINNNQNYDTMINTGTSTGALTLGNAVNGGAINIASASEINVDGATTIDGNTTITGTFDLNLDNNNAVNICNGSSNSAITIGNSSNTGGIEIASAGGISLTGSTDIIGATSINGNTEIGGGTLTVIGTTSIGGTTNINASNNANVNICTGTSTGATAIGNLSNGAAVTLASLSGITLNGQTGINGTTTISGTTNINTSNNANVNICTGTSTGATTIGGTSNGGAVIVGAKDNDITLQTAGTGDIILTSASDISLSGTVALSGQASINANNGANTFIGTGTATGSVTIGNATNSGGVAIASANGINLTGVTNINASTNSNVNICTGTSTGNVTIGNAPSTGVTSIYGGHSGIVCGVASLSISADNYLLQAVSDIFLECTVTGSNPSAINITTASDVGHIILGSSDITTTGPLYINAGVVTTTDPSAARFKNNIESFDVSDEAFKKLHPVTFEYKTDKKKLTHFGLIADEIAALNDPMLSLVVRYDKEGNIEGLDYNAIFVMMLQKMIQLVHKVEQLSQSVMNIQSEKEMEIQNLQKELALLTHMYKSKE